MEAFIKSNAVKGNKKGSTTCKTNEIRKHLERVGHITSMEAYDLYGLTRLSSVIYVLRRRGMNIISESAAGIDRYGNRMSYAVYRLVKDDE